MAGTRAGGLKTKKTIEERYGEDFWQKRGAKGGASSGTGGFYENPARAVTAGQKGGVARFAFGDTYVGPKQLELLRLLKRNPLPQPVIRKHFKHSTYQILSRCQQRGIVYQLDDGRWAVTKDGWHILSFDNFQLVDPKSHPVLPYADPNQGKVFNIPVTVPTEDWPPEWLLFVATFAACYVFYTLVTTLR